jgi:hypothetical protein
LITQENVTHLTATAAGLSAELAWPVAWVWLADPQAVSVALIATTAAVRRNERRSRRVLTGISG